MTEANQKRLYEHYKKNGLFDRAAELLQVYPHFEKETEETEKPKKSK